MKKDIEKKEAEKSKKREETNEKIKKIFEDVTDEAMEKAKELKKKYDKADPKTKNIILAGLSAAAAGLAIIAGIKKHKDKGNKQ